MIHYLALGDSYTIGEQVKAEDNFPNQVFRLLRDEGYAIEQPRIIASTGWTTDELQEAIRAARIAEPFDDPYDLVTLLIGVNNQYRGRDPENYREEFETLLMQAIGFAGNRKDRVIVLSIPDWGVTPFAEGRDRAEIARSIDAFNSVNRQAADTQGVFYIDVTESTRKLAGDPASLTEDRLHLSATVYRQWAEAIRQYVVDELKDISYTDPDGPGIR